MYAYSAIASHRICIAPSWTFFFLFILFAFSPSSSLRTFVSNIESLTSSIIPSGCLLTLIVYHNLLSNLRPVSYFSYNGAFWGTQRGRKGERL